MPGICKFSYGRNFTFVSTIPMVKKCTSNFFGVFLQCCWLLGSNCNWFQHCDYPLPSFFWYVKKCYPCVKIFDFLCVKTPPCALFFFFESVREKQIPCVKISSKFHAVKQLKCDVKIIKKTSQFFHRQYFFVFAVDIVLWF